MMIMIIIILNIIIGTTLYFSHNYHITGFRRSALLFLTLRFCPLPQVCLASSSPSTFHFVLVHSLHRIITNVSAAEHLVSLKYALRCQDQGWE